MFAAVGSLHMIGPNGLPALLRQRGYGVEQVRFGALSAARASAAAGRQSPHRTHEETR